MDRVTLINVLNVLEYLSSFVFSEPMLERFMNIIVGIFLFETWFESFFLLSLKTFNDLLLVVQNACLFKVLPSEAWFFRGLFYHHLEPRLSLFNVYGLLQALLNLLTVLCLSLLEISTQLFNSAIKLCD